MENQIKNDTEVGEKKKKKRWYGRNVFKEARKIKISHNPC